MALCARVFPWRVAGLRPHGRPSNVRSSGEWRVTSGEKKKSGGERGRRAGPFEAQGKLKPGLFLYSGGSLDPFPRSRTGLKTGYYKEDLTAGRLRLTL